MADVNFSFSPASTPRPENEQGEPPLYELIELFFFAYRDFVADPDHALEAYGFGRAHHRVLHFVDRNPDLTVAELLDILKITKQSLARVLKDLVDQGFILQREGREDRRQRLLTTTVKGKQLAVELATTQSQRIARALAEAGLTGPELAQRFLFAMVDPDGRAEVARLIRDNITKSDKTRGEKR
ncbi:MarR family transcriptional regulator [Labrys sp. WJW]|uniref:MarR family winged helix-turn-helix transcriptional regulator n=1 Tax=Labrys sp. WJW TaxID=1737983 RepID=UPI000835B6C9|nr:MarR family transcriptional regulator [Labrys sp. WJW]OCC04138.1 MarR family transcriptional regulator [Labrys sp. WJW]